ncbi:hypothetical protein SLS60_006895 [Paraconiothyrium brasiliense]|uniref:Gamma-glutamylcyclotransferase AIG2-like domain-containing protein n=1 Tax=Paraconiothyrium brasiliense TaxID=300254 RepID=A0ABR3R8M9_9PLEO
MSTLPYTQYFLKLSCPVETKAKLHVALQDDTVPVIEFPELHGATALYAYMTSFTVLSLLRQFPQADFKVYRARKPATKDLSNTSIAPTLGIDISLPQHRNLVVDPRPRQDEYPVRYFFYGTLCEPERLAQVLGIETIVTSDDGTGTDSQDDSTIRCGSQISEGGCQEASNEEEKDQGLQSHEDATLTPAPILTPACILRGKVRSWRGKYAALVDGDEDDLVQGWVYDVKTREDEDRLREYEGGNYEVVRCEISVTGEVVLVRGLTFRFCGKKNELQEEEEEDDGSEEDDGEESEGEKSEDESTDKVSDEEVSDEEDPDDDDLAQEGPDAEELGEELGEERSGEKETEDDYHEASRRSPMKSLVGRSLRMMMRKNLRERIGVFGDARASCTLDF